MLATVGVTLKLRAADNVRDRGGGAGKRFGKNGTDDATSASVGAVIAAGADAKLQHVYMGGAAERAGLAAGDVLIALDGLRVSGSSLETMLEHRRAGETLAIHAFRRDELFTTAFTLGAAPLDTCWLTQDEDVAAETAARPTAWLGPA
jgi:predicted metalloprotease with PDZ domain